MRAHIIEGTEVGTLMEKIFGKIAVFFDHPGTSVAFAKFEFYFKILYYKILYYIIVCKSSANQGLTAVFSKTVQPCSFSYARSTPSEQSEI